MTTVTIGSARIDENGNARGGKAGDQTGKELSTQAWYKHKKGWRVFRAIDVEKRGKIAKAMLAACDSPFIGYDQGQRLSLYNAAKDVGFDIEKVKTACETDCSALVRVCLAFAGISCANFTTSNQAAALLGSGDMIELKAPKYTDKPDYLCAGDVLVTRTQGHTVIAITSGDLAANDYVDLTGTQSFALGERTLRYGDGGADVRDLQTHLQARGLFTGTPMGNYMVLTERAVKAFQREAGLDADGIYGPKTHAALLATGNDTSAEDGAAADVPFADAADDGRIATVVMEETVLRAGAGEDYAVIRKAYDGDAFELADTDKWVPVKSQNMVLWLKAEDCVLG